MREKRRMYRGIVVMITLVCAAMLTRPAMAVEFAGGTGQPDDPYQIATAEQLIAIGDDPDLQSQCYILIADIDLDPNVGTGDGQGPRVFDAAVLNLTGEAVFDGNDHTIHNLAIEGPTELVPWIYDEGVALFGEIEAGTTIKNLTLENVQVSGAYNVGGLVGICNGQIIECSASGTVSGYDDVGGLVGEAKGRIVECDWTGYVTGRRRIGGLVGNALFGFVERSRADGTVVGQSGIGGLAGAGSILISCLSSGLVIGVGDVGGLAGRTGDDEYTSTPTGLIFQCHSDASVSGETYVGGLVGNNSVTIRSCYATGSTMATEASGALVGANSGAIEASYATGQAIYQHWAGGFVGDNSGHISHCFGLGQLVVNTTSPSYQPATITQSYYLVPDSEESWSYDKGMPLTVIEAMDPASFVGWDFFAERTNGHIDHWHPAPSRFPALAWQSDITGFQAIPYVVGLSVEEAQRQLAQTGFTAGPTTYAWHRDTEGLLSGYYSSDRTDHGAIREDTVIFTIRLYTTRHRDKKSA